MIVVDGVIFADRVVPAPAFAEDKAEEDEGTSVTPGRATKSPPVVVA